MQWLKLYAWKFGDRGFKPRSGIQVSKKQKPPPPTYSWRFDIVGSLRDIEVECSASDRHGSNFKICVWRVITYHSSHHPQEVLVALFSLYLHKGGLKPHSFLRLHASQYQICGPTITAINHDDEHSYWFSSALYTYPQHVWLCALHRIASPCSFSTGYSASRIFSQHI